MAGGEETVTCPRGHEVAASAVIVSEGFRICPVCSSEDGNPWRTQPARWSRQQLGGPLVLLSGAVLISAIAGFLGLGYSMTFMSNSSPGATWLFVSGLVDSIGSLFMVAAIIWIALLVKRA